MNQTKTNKLIESWLKEFAIYAPVKSGNRILISKITSPEEIYFGDDMPEYSWKRFLLPSKEDLFLYKGSKVLLPRDKDKKIMLLGVNVLDLKAITFFLQVFEKDPYIQANIKRIVLVGMSSISGNVEYNVFSEKYEDDTLSHLIFDIFIEKQKKEFRFLTGSEEGQKLCDKAGVEKYDNVVYEGHQKEPDKKVLSETITNSRDAKFWDELGEICLECGKCSLVCPTCYCYELCDVSGAKYSEGKRQREWSNCFYREFSEIFSKERVLNSTKARIYFWYYHKFVRDFDKYGMPGCVGCGRCSKTCPVGIKLHETLEKSKAISNKRR